MGRALASSTGPTQRLGPRSIWYGLAAAYFSYFGLLGTLQPYLATLYLEHGLSAAQVGPSVALLYVLAGLMPLVVTWAAARLAWNARQAFGLCAASATAVSLLLAVAGHAFSDVGFVVLIATLTALYAPLNALLDTSALQACQENEWSFGRLRLMGSVGYIVTATVLGRVLPMSQMSSQVHIATTVLVACVLATTAWLPAASLSEQQGAAQTSKGHDIKPSQASLFCLVAACGLHYASFGPFQYGFTLYGRFVGLTPMQIGLGWSLGVASEVAMFSVTGALLKRWGWQPLLWVAFCVAPMRWLALSALPHPVTFFVTQPLHGPCFAMFYAAAMAALDEVTPEARARRSQTVFCALVAGLASGPAMLVAGYAYAYMSLSSMFACMLPANVLSLCLLGLSVRYARRSPIASLFQASSSNQ